MIPRILYLNLSNLDLIIPSGYILMELEFNNVDDADIFILSQKEYHVYYYSFKNKMFVRNIYGDEIELKSKIEFYDSLNMINGSIEYMFSNMKI